jgi:predicted amidophosphoribosyltransferase
MENSEDNIGYFFNRLDPILKKGFPIAIVPSHDPDERNWGLIKLVRRLSSAGRIDASSCLVRTVKIDTQHNLKEGERKKLKRHLDSIEVRDEALIKSKVVLLLDDIVTTGASLMACKKLLLEAGASEVICVALGKATQ